MKNKNILRLHHIFLLFLLIGPLVGCQVKSIDAYDKAMVDAAFPHEGEIASDLTAITRTNNSLKWKDDQDRKRRLVVSWKKKDSYEQFLKGKVQTTEDLDHVVWVTAAPEVQRFCSDYLKSHPEAGADELNLRLKQYLGLNAEEDYDLFVEMWVSPESLFRPCVDPQPDDSRCDLHFDKTTPQVPNISDYREFYTKLYYKNFRDEGGLPWTGIGYTYDWGNPEGERGASEFILTPNSPYEIVFATLTEEYCRRGVREARGSDREVLPQE